MSRIFEALRRSEEANAQVRTLSVQEGEIPRQKKEVPVSRRTTSHNGSSNAKGTAGAELESSEHVRCHPRPEDHLITMNGEAGPAEERFRVLCHRIEQMRQQRQLRQLLVTSAIPKEGKTVVPINLAALFARTFPRVLLVDADMRNPGISRALGIPLLPGLAEFLEGKIDRSAAIRRVDPV